MKLFEITDTPMTPMDALDNTAFNGELASKAVPAERIAAGNPPRGKAPRKSNVGKAKRIANLVQMKKRESNPKESDTPAQSSLGGHGSSFLGR